MLLEDSLWKILFVFYFFWPCGILVSPGIDPRPLWKFGVLTTGLPGRSSVRVLNLSLYISWFTLSYLSPERQWKRKKSLCASLCSVLCFVAAVRSLRHVWLSVTPWTAPLPCPPLSPLVCSDSRPLSYRCYLSHPLLPPSPPALNLSQHQGLLQWIGTSHQMAKVLELQLQHQSFQWILRVDFL